MGSTNSATRFSRRAGNLAGIAGLMILNLEAQKFVHGGNGAGVFRCDADARAVLGVFQFVLNGFAQTLHGLRAGRILGVDEHGRGKIAHCKHLCDVAEVHADFIARGRVAGRVGLDVDGAAVRIENEMVGGFVMREAHDVIAAFDDALMMVVLRGRFVLGRRLILRKAVQRGE